MPRFLTASLRHVVTVMLLVSWILPAIADDGMWTYDNPPRKQLKEVYGFEPTQQWLDHVRLASVRFNDGGSGSFISGTGLVLTNHHVARGQLQKMSTPQMDYVKEGFYARASADEVKCTDLELNVLVSMEEVTKQVMAAVKPGMSGKVALDARKAAIGALTKESMEKTGLRSDIVSFYQGSEYWIYRYKKYTDVRLVFAPEMAIAFYGGDDDNFTYPRYDLDMTIFRVYENDKPIHSDNYLKWNSAGAAENDLVFVSGHPGSTNRLQTLAQTEYQRDVAYPSRLKMYARRIEVLRKYARLGKEQERRAGSQIFGLMNSQKAVTGEYNGLRDKALMAKKAAEEKDFRDRVNANPEWKAAYGWAWDSVSATITRTQARRGTSYRMVTGRLYGFAQTLVQYAQEIVKPNGERQAAYQDAALPAVTARLLSRAPVYLDLDEFQMADGFQESLEELGKDDPFVKLALAGRTPEQAAKELIAGSKLADPAVRKALMEGGQKAIDESTDPMIVLARGLMPMAKEAREWNEKYVSSTLTTASEKIGEARFKVYGKTTYPDATFTLRLSYGTVKGYPMNGTIAPAKTTMYGLYDRAYSFTQKGDFALPKRYVDGMAKVNLATPMNFVSTCDIIGGNSGSPVVNKAGEIVGLIFDGNIESLPGRFLYSEEANRAVAVHTAAMMECLRNLYDASALANEIEGK